MDTLKIERLGGLAGFGLPGSRLQSRGEQAMSALSQADRAQLEVLFQGASRTGASAKTSDGFHYRITRTVDGREQTVEVPEAAVPMALKSAVVDTLK